MIAVRIPSSYKREREYVLGTVLGEFLGLDFKVERSERAEVTLTAGDSRSLVLADSRCPPNP
jgi:hypothetical protein